MVDKFCVSSSYVRSSVKSSLFHSLILGTWFTVSQLAETWRGDSTNPHDYSSPVFCRPNIYDQERCECELKTNSMFERSESKSYFDLFTCRSLCAPVISWTAWPAQWRRRLGRIWGVAGGRSCAGESPGERARRWGPGPGRETGGRAETARGRVSWQTELPGSRKWH